MLKELLRDPCCVLAMLALVAGAVWGIATKVLHLTR